MVQNLSNSLVFRRLSDKTACQSCIKSAVTKTKAIKREWYNEKCWLQHSLIHTGNSLHHVI